MSGRISGNYGEEEKQIWDIGYKLPQIILNYEIPKRHINRCVHRSAGTEFLEWERSGYVEWHITGEVFSDSLECLKPLVGTVDRRSEG